MAIPIRYRRASEQSIATYDFFDLAEGTGKVTLYGGGLNLSGSSTYGLSKEAFDPWHTGTSSSGTGIFETGRNSRGSTTNSTFTSLIDKTFEMTPFNLPKVIGGDMLCQIPFGTSIITSDRSVSSYFEVNVIIDSTTIATGYSETQGITSVAGVDTKTGMASFFVTIPDTVVKIGEQLKIQVIGYARRSNGASQEIGLIMGHDPLNRAITAVDAAGSIEERLAISTNTDLKFFVPFKVNL